MKKEKCQYSKGFSLVEFAIVIVIIAIVVSFSLTSYKSQIGSVEVKNTEDKLKTIKSALDTYLRTNNRLPCPADGTAAAGAASYGVEASSCSPSSCPSGMVCGTRSVRGALPFVTLGLTNAYGDDEWVSKISYVVDNLFTQTDSNCESPGALSVVDYNDNSVSTSAAYILISHGVDGAGGYKKNVGTYASCNTTYKDGENCDADDVFRVSEIKPTPTTTTDYFDDVVLWSGNPNLKTCPAGVRDCRIWLDSSDKCTITLTSGKVSEWRSKGNYKHRALQSSSSIMPTYINTSGSLINGRSFVRFASGDFMYIIDTAGDSTISSLSDAEYSQISVFRSTDTDGIIFTLASSNSYTATTIDRTTSLYTSKVNHYNYNGAGEALQSTANFNDNLPHVITASAGANSVHKLWIDSTLISTGSQTGSGFTSKAALNLGGHSSAGYFAGDLLEVMYFDYVLSNEERKLLETYFATKWGLNY